VQTRFWIDTCSLVQAHRHIYPPDQNPTPEFWGFMAGHIANGTVCSTKTVYDEIMLGKDYLKQWAKHRRNLKIKPTRTVQAAYRKVADFVRSTYPTRWWDEFLDDGDAWVIASAFALGGKVVTQESSSRLKKIRIPVVCEQFEVKWTDIKGMLNELNAPFD
jgi:hypothetical protein